jgi:hypothetical protein
MMWRHRVAVGLLALALTGCESLGQRTLLTPRTFPDPKVGDSGVVIAETDVVGAASALAKDGGAPDCEPGYGLNVKTSTGKDAYLVDRKGNPCPKADVLFDGQQKINQRQADPGISIGFVDRYGPVPPRRETNPPPRPMIDLTTKKALTADTQRLSAAPEGTAETAEQMPAEIAAMADAERAKRTAEQTKALEKDLGNTIQNWKTADERARLMREAERMMADARNINRFATMELTRAEQEKIQALTAQLREAERVAQAQREENERLAAAMQKTRAQEDAERTAKERDERKAREESEQLALRLKELERYNAKLKQQYEAQQQGHVNKIAKLSADLKAAEAQSQAARQAAVLQAAKQIAEAERLSIAARVAQRQAMEQEAQRLQREADELAVRARELPKDLPQERSKQVDEAYASMLSGAIKDADTVKLARIINTGRPDAEPLDNVQLVLNEKDVPLKDIFAKILKDIEPRVGAWTMNWELQSLNAGIPDETWSITAESSFNDLLAYVTDTVRETHGVELSFKVFEKNRVIVVTDAE